MKNVRRITDLGAIDAPIGCWPDLPPTRSLPGAGPSASTRQRCAQRIAVLMQMSNRLAAVRAEAPASTKPDHAFSQVLRVWCRHIAPNDMLRPQTRRSATAWRMVEAGGLMAYDSYTSSFVARTATYVDKILRGINPADLPVEQPTKLELVLNLKTAKALDLTIPPSLLARVDEVIE
jgi:hypothetical protein